LSEFLKYAMEVAARRLAGEIALSGNIGSSLREWRESFNLNQASVARRMMVSPSVVSDYEAGRRRNPGVDFLRRFVEALLGLDAEAGGRKVLELSRIGLPPPGVILGIHEFNIPVRASDIVQAVRGEVVACPENLGRPVFGYTVLDSLRAIVSLSGNDLIHLYGATNERALVFTNVEHGRSPLVAIRIFPFKPRVVVMHGPQRLDPVAIQIARAENLLTAISRAAAVKEILDALASMEGKPGVALA